MEYKGHNDTQDPAANVGVVEFIAPYKSSKLKSGDSLRVNIPPTLPELRRGGTFIVEFRRIDDGTASLLSRATGSKPTKMAARSRSKSKVATAKAGKRYGRKRGRPVGRKKVSRT